MSVAKTTTVINSRYRYTSFPWRVCSHPYRPRAFLYRLPNVVTDESHTDSGPLKVLQSSTQSRHHVGCASWSQQYPSIFCVWWQVRNTREARGVGVHPSHSHGKRADTVIQSAEITNHCYKLPKCNREGLCKHCLGMLCRWARRSVKVVDGLSYGIHEWLYCRRKCLPLERIQDFGCLTSFFWYFKAGLNDSQEPDLIGGITLNNIKLSHTT